MHLNLTPIQIESFWSKVDRTGECWLWTGCLSPKGYGQFRVRPTTQQAHRVAWMIEHGAIPDGLCVCHTCDVRACCNPAHLWLGTNAENSWDKVIKGRARTSNRVGQNNYNAKLTDEIVRAIRLAYDSGVTQAEIARDFELSRSAICMIVQRKRWAHV